MKKLTATLLSLMLIFSMMAAFTVVSSAGELVPDENLRIEINKALGNGPVSTPVTIDQLNSLTGTFSASDKDISSIEGLQYATGLTRIYLNDNNISDLTPLSDLTGLKWLYLRENQISNIEPLSNLTNLTRLSLNANQISDITTLSDLTHLKWLYLRENQINNITPLSELTDLSQLSLIENNIVDITPLSNLTNLKGLFLRENKINDISALSNLKKLTRLYMDGNQISDISPIQGLPSLNNFSAMDQKLEVPVPATFESMIFDIDGTPIALTPEDEDSSDNGDGTYTLTGAQSMLGWQSSQPFSGQVLVVEQSEPEDPVDPSDSQSVSPEQKPTAEENQGMAAAKAPGIVKKSPDTGENEIPYYETLLLLLISGTGVYVIGKKKI